MNYIFIFLGEFGYELLNWQGVVRNIVKQLSKKDKIICCSRKGLEPFYEEADLYINISEVSNYKNSLACVYHALPASKLKDIKFLGRATRKLHNFFLKRALKKYIYRQIDAYNKKNKDHIIDLTKKNTFVFSDCRNELRGAVIGSSTFGSENGEKFEGSIYADLNYKNNIYKKIKADSKYNQVVEKKLGFFLDEPFILCQSRESSIRNFAPDALKIDELLICLAQKINTVLLSFDTGRNKDSFSKFASIPGTCIYDINNFIEQAILINHAQKCLFFTEGDFGSHIYLPPFLGKDVFAVAPDLVYQLETSPVEFWNKNIFKFGGQIKPAVMENIIENKEKMEVFINDKILG